MRNGKPHILFIVSDQHRADCLGCCGNADVRTPALDSLAADGTVYEESYCTSPLCTPSRYSLLTGLYPHQHLGWSNVSTIPPGTETFASLARRAGYRTAAVGKMHLTPTYQEIGFDEMILAEQNGEGRFEDDYHHELSRHGLIDKVDLIDQVSRYRSNPQFADGEYWSSLGTRASDLPEYHHSTAWIGREAMKRIESWEDGQPQLLMVSFIKPHHPFDPPKPWDAMYDPDRLRLLPGYAESCPPGDLALHEGFFPHRSWSEPQLRRAMAHYYGAISHMDHYIGRILQLLKDRGLYEDTLIIFTSDHGEYMGFHHMLLKQNYAYDPLVKVPLIVKWPGLVRAGTRDARLVGGVDVTATIVAQAGAQPAHGMTGLHLADPAAKRPYVYCEELRGRQYMIRSREFKLILCEEEAKCRFFDLRSDPLEWNNLYGSGEYRKEIAELTEALMRWTLFSAPSPNYWNGNAPALEKGARRAQERDALKEWVDARMKIQGAWSRDE